MTDKIENVVLRFTVEVPGGREVVEKVPSGVSEEDWADMSDEERHRHAIEVFDGWCAWGWEVAENG